MTRDMDWIVITGSTGGLGQAIVNLLSAAGHNLILVNRSQSKSLAQKKALVRDVPGIRVETVVADFLDTRSVESAIQEICALNGRVKAMYNNAGVLTKKHIRSRQGFESTFAVNVLTPYQLILGLRDKMMCNTQELPSAIVNVTSGVAVKLKTLETSQLANPDTVSGLNGTYAQSKLALIVLTTSLAETLRSDGIFIRAVDPGATRTPMTLDNPSMPVLLKWIAPLLFQDASKQAKKLINAASPESLSRQTGILVANMRQLSLPAPAVSEVAKKQLMDLLERSLRAS
ncbi:MAG: SDR family NAD(P)-dependent oxidoreductase [Pseudomonadota bacterium]